MATANKQVVCNVLMELAKEDKDIVVLCSDSRGSGSMTPFADALPEQFIEVGIAEQSLVSMAAGLANAGKKPVAVSPASFLSTRSMEQVKVDCAYSHMNVKLLGISGGVSYGALGMTHHSTTDIATIGSIPGMRVYFPSDRLQTEKLTRALMADTVRARTGLNLSPYFPASKMGWIMENVPEARELAGQGRLCFGTVDSWLLSFLTREKVHATDYSNASRTQLFDITKLRWDEGLCRAFGVPVDALPEVRMSDSVFGMTDLGGYLDEPIPVCGVLGDSHGALFGQDCRKPGQVKATYGTGSSVMMNIGAQPRFSEGGLVTSLAWGMNGRVEYVFEGNLNYTGAVMTWLRRDVGLIENDAEATELARAANPNDRCYFVPAFSGLGAPYWDSRASGMLTGVSRTTGRAEIAKACLECIAYQITDLTELMRRDADVELASLRVDGGPTASEYLMQFQSDMARASVEVPNLQELSGMGAAYAAGISAGIYDPDRVYEHVRRRVRAPAMDAERREELYKGWQAAVRQVLMHD